MNPRFTPVRKALVACALIAAPALAAPPDLNDFLPPAQGGPAQPAGRATVVAKGEVVQAENMQDAMGHAHKKLLEDGPGVQAVSTKTGMGVIAMARASYQAYQNPNATRLSKRSAYMRAYIDAQARLGKFERGFSSACENAVSSNLVAIDTGVESAANSRTSTSETCKQSFQGMVNGFVTYSVDDDVKEQAVTVAIAASAKTRSALQRPGPAVLAVEDLQAGWKEIVAEITSGVIPPMGARLITKPSTGETIVVGFGSAIIRENTNKALRTQLTDMAKKQAEIRARHSIVAFLTGTAVYWSGGFEEKQLESIEQFEIPKDPKSGKPADPVVYNKTRDTFLNVVKSSDDYKTVAKGDVPPGVIPRSFKSQDGEWMLAVAVYAPSMAALAQQLSSGGQGSAAGTPAGRSMHMQGGLVEGGGRSTRGPSGQVTNRNDF